MIKFFRKIRQRLLSENKLSKYLFYAIGEIILVIIGILIALYINNKNEVRLIENKFISNLLQVQKELEVNIESTTSSINYYLTKDSLIGIVMDNSLTFEDYNSDMNNTNINSSRGQGLSYIIFNTIQVDNLNNSFIKLNQSTEELPNEFYLILEEINKVYSQYRTALIDWNNKMLDLENSNIAKFTDNYSWFNKIYYFEKSNSDAFEYFVNNPIYKNLISQYSFLAEEHFEAIKTYRIEAIKTHKAISNFLKLEEKSDSISNKFSLNKALLNCYAGKYSFGSGSTCEIIINNDKLFLIYDGDNIDLIKISQIKFVAIDYDMSIIFKDSKNCESNSFTWFQDGSSFKFDKEIN